jgi:hypothetical protein
MGPREREFLRRQRAERDRAQSRLAADRQSPRGIKVTPQDEVEPVQEIETALVAGRLRLIPSMRQLIVQNREKETITLTDQQLKVLQVLFEMYSKGILEAPTKEVLRRADVPQRTGNTKLRDLFQS